ncbi:CCA tRNA nucleotidyltransferase [Natronorarus salvus]|uniref:CCA tRNA nucleotidyltransferase n=1 Tax=Natronorarus salvus TaxID=3117733 RepID=UPI002F264449
MTEDRALSEAVAAVRERVTPDEAERRALARVAADLVSRTEEAVADLPVEADVLRVGSTARDTWLAGDRDIDVFVRFPPDLGRDDLERYGLAVGHRVLPDGREEYAEHPYVTGEIEGFDVDLVPCYRLDAATEIRSAVDRTPFHTRYVESELTPDLASEVRVLKAFLTAYGLYGSDLRTEGFSGYLTELLVIEYGGFEAVCRAAADWHPPVELDPADHGEASFDDPLVVIDPTDPERNVAAVLSETNVARFQHHARALLADPLTERFESTDPPPLSEEEVRSLIDRRGTTPLAIRFEVPEIVDDQLYPQLRRTLTGLVERLARHGFEPLRAETVADDTALLLVECAVASLPAVERHLGPPVHVRTHAEAFTDAYAEDRESFGPFVDGERYVVERPREFTTPETLVRETLFDGPLGPDVERALEGGYDLFVGGSVASLAEEFGADLARYYDPRP